MNCFQNSLSISTCTTTPGAPPRGRAPPHRGKVVQVDPINPMSKPPGSKHLKLKCDELLSSFAFKFNLRRYTVAAAVLTNLERASPDLRLAYDLQPTAGPADLRAVSDMYMRAEKALDAADAAGEPPLPAAPGDEPGAGVGVGGAGVGGGAGAGGGGGAGGAVHTHLAVGLGRCCTPHRMIPFDSRDKGLRRIG